MRVPVVPRLKAIRELEAPGRATNVPAGKPTKQHTFGVDRFDCRHVMEMDGQVAAGGCCVHRSGFDLNQESRSRPLNPEDRPIAQAGATVKSKQPRSSRLQNHCHTLSVGTIVAASEGFRIVRMTDFTGSPTSNQSVT